MSIAENRRARYEFDIGTEFEAGIKLVGSELRAMRAGKTSIAEAYVGCEGDELFLVNAHIDLMQGSLMGGHLGGHEPKRKRKLLMHRREIDKIAGEIHRGGMTAVPLSLYFTARGVVKLKLALAKGRKEHDKRAAIKDREWQRDKARVLSASN